jgi:hypothetical protein
MKKLRLLGLALPLPALVFLLLPLLATVASGASGNTKYQWDIINFDFATSTITPGGQASAFATGGGGSTHTGRSRSPVTAPSSRAPVTRKTSLAEAGGRRSGAVPRPGAATTR